MKFETQLIHGGTDGDVHTGAVNIPIYQTSTYAQSAIGVHKGYEYSRTGNPTRQALERLIAVLEGGTAGFAYGSGLAAIASVLMLFKTGDHIILGNDVYGGTFRVIDKVFSQYGLTYSFIDAADLKTVEAEIRPETKAIFLETPSNPLMKLTDIRATAALAKRHGLLTIVDNTFMTPYLQRPIELGANIVLHSATKYLGGHSDVVAGLVIVDSEELAAKVHFIQNAVGAILGPQDSFLLIKGIRTLALRMDRHNENAQKIYQWLKKQPWVTKIYYAGAHEHQMPKALSDQMKGFGGMISFDVDSEATLNKLLSQLSVITLAESLGGVESLISVPARMTHASIPSEIRRKNGITDTLIRLSVGIEAADDLISDLDITYKVDGETS